MGKVYNKMTKKLEDREIVSRSDDPEEQYWERTELPEDWKKKRRFEKAKMETDPDYIDVELETFRQQEWDRRINGYWYMNNGTPTFLTGLHYFYVNWWVIDTGYPEYRNPDRLFFYYLDYAIDDPYSMGVYEVTKRRQGKTKRGGCFVYEGISRKKRAEGGIQSKTGKDAKNNVYLSSIILPFKHLPDFFRPEYDKSAGLTPKTELIFQQTNVRGKAAEAAMDKEELESKISWQSADKFAYDGTKLYRYLADEVGKTTEVDIYERHEVVQFCMRLEGAIIGKALYTTTVEEMEEGGKPAKKLWTESDPNERKAHGRTKSGLYRFFTSTLDTYNYDKYGMPDREENLRIEKLEREALKDDPAALSSYIRKNPIYAEEAFRLDGDNCIYNAVALNDQRDELTWRLEEQNIFEVGSFEWKGGQRDTEVYWKKKHNGRFKLHWDFKDKDDANSVVLRGSSILPAKRKKFVIGCDPYDHYKTTDGRFSNAAAYVYYKYTSSDIEMSDRFIVEYIGRPPSPKIFYEDMIKLCHYFGAEILFEDNKQGIRHYFEERGYFKFLMRLPGRKEPGIPGSKNSHQEIAELTEEHIDQRISAVMFPRLIEDWLEFDLSNTTDFDPAMAAGYTLIAKDASIRKMRNVPDTDTSGMTKLFKKRKITSKNGTTSTVPRSRSASKK